MYLKERLSFSHLVHLPRLWSANGLLLSELLQRPLSVNGARSRINLKSERSLSLGGTLFCLHDHFIPSFNIYRNIYRGAHGCIALWFSVGGLNTLTLRMIPFIDSAIRKHEYINGKWSPQLCLVLWYSRNIVMKAWITPWNTVWKMMLLKNSTLIVLSKTKSLPVLALMT